MGVLFHFSMLPASAFRSNSSAASKGVGIGGKMPAMETDFAILRSSMCKIGHAMSLSVPHSRLVVSRQAVAAGQAGC